MSAPAPGPPEQLPPGSGPGLPRGPLPVAAVARRLGVAPATLRTWDRRYGLGPSEHAAGAHRRYSPADVSRLEEMRRLTLEGVPPAEAARTVLSPGVLPAGGSAGGVPSPAGPDVAESGPLPDRHGRMRGGGPGGRVLSLPGAPALVVGLGRAAMALDSETVSAVVRAQLAEHGVLPTWEHLLRPVLAAVGARWAATGHGVEVEHLLAECVTGALREVAARPGPSEQRPVLLAGAPGEHHALPLHALAAGLAERGLASRVLGGAMPPEALQAAVVRTGPAALFVWSQLPETGGPAALEAVPVTRPPTALVVGGPGWQRDALPERVAVADGLADAVELLCRAAGS